MKNAVDRGVELVGSTELSKICHASPSESRIGIGLGKEFKEKLIEELVILLAKEKLTIGEVAILYNTTPLTAKMLMINAKVRMKERK